MSNAIKNAALGLAAISAMAGGLTTTKKESSGSMFDGREYPEQKVRTPEEKAKRKAHKAKLQAKRRAQKGIYEHKIVYKKKKAK